MVASDRSAGPRQGVVLMAAAVMPAMAIISLVPVLPMLLREFGDVPGAAVLVPMTLTVPALCVALFSPLAGWLSDRIGRKRVLVAALLLYGAIGLMPLALHSLVLILGSRILLGLNEAAITTVATTMIGDYYEGARRERWVAIQTAVVSLSAIVLIALGGVLGEAFGSRGPFLLYLLALPIAALAAAILFEPATTARAAPRPAFPLRPVAAIIATTLAAAVLFYTLLLQIGPVLGLAGVTSPAVIGAVGAAANVGVVLGSLAFRRLAALPTRGLLAAGFGLAAAGYLGVAYLGGVWAVTGLTVLACIGGGILLPTLLTAVLRVLPAFARGRGTGLWTGTFFLGQFVAPVLAAGLAQATGGLRPALAILGWCALAGAAVLALRRERRPALAMRG
ncbi:MFS transporter [Sphingomonas metalli]|uniref:MFS transporter n=1 Tax=Sphingomonas metalli TaxID=1779358 RepID=A0A916TBY2_9SPHN|nr:MFS transporter [Sphingomonas metalli]GGB38126.1 MFS transporter [Sphingomonas metalli]